MGVEIDEARTDHASAGVDDARRFDVAHVAAQDAHAFAIHRHRAVEADVARAVDNLPAGYQQVKHAHPRYCAR